MCEARYRQFEKKVLIEYTGRQGPLTRSWLSSAANNVEMRGWRGGKGSICVYVYVYVYVYVQITCKY